MTSSAKVLLTTEDLSPWEEEVERLTREIDERVEKRDEISSKLKTVYDVLAQLGQLRPETVVKPKPMRLTPSAAKLKRRRIIRRKEDVTWLSEIKRVAAEELQGMTYVDLKAGIDLGPLSERLKQSDKGLYGAVAKLEASGEIVRHNGRMFDPEVLDKFQRRVEAGEIEDVTPPVTPERSSPMGDAIMNFIERHPFGVESGEIADHLKSLPQFTVVVTKNKTAAYNVIKRLLDRGKIRKVGNKYLPLETE